MEIHSITSNYITPKTTGYAATTGLALSALTGLSKNRKMSKMHKPISIGTALLTAFHVGLIEYNHHKWKKEIKA